MSFPNQKIITIHKHKYKDNFLQIGIEEWQEFVKSLRYVDDKKILEKPKQGARSSTIAMFLYLASNADGFDLELSKVAFENATGFSDSTYFRAINELTALHYIYKGADGSLNFATTPHEDMFQNWGKDDSDQRQASLKSDYKESQIGNKVYSGLNTEIDNKYNKEIIDKIDTPPKSDFSYLDVGSDGSFDNGQNSITWFDSIIPCFWGLPHDKKISEITKNTRFNEDEAKYIVDNILEWDEGKYDRSSPYAYLYEEVSPYGYHNGKYFDEEIENFWCMPDNIKKQILVNECNYTMEEADFIVYKILSKDSIVTINKLLTQNRNKNGGTNYGIH